MTPTLDDLTYQAAEAYYHWVQVEGFGSAEECREALSRWARDPEIANNPDFDTDGTRQQERFADAATTKWHGAARALYKAYQDLDETMVPEQIQNAMCDKMRGIACVEGWNNLLTKEAVQQALAQRSIRKPSELQLL